MDLLYNLKTQKAAVSPYPGRHPIIMKENIAETQEEKKRLQLLAPSTLSLDGLLGEEVLVDIW
jgi:hypothetical protein